MKLWISFKKWLELISGTIRSLCGDPEAWESSIRQFEVQDKRQPPTPNSILFVGSSTFTLWKTLEKDMSPLKIINRGFGGSKITDIVRYSDRIVIPYNPKAIVLFAGTNDIAWPKPATAQQVYQAYLAFTRQVSDLLPTTQIYYVAITPTPARWTYWEIANEANRLIQQHSRTDDRFHFIDLTARFIGPDGKPDRKLYRMDGLHPNQKGYAVWTETIKPILEVDLG